MADISLDICSKALLLIGANAITSFDGNTRESEVCNSLYNLIKESALTARLWGFSLTKLNLARLNQTPLNTYSYAYQIPSNVLRIKKSSTGKEFDIQGDKLLTNSSEVIVDCQVNVDDNIIPAFFKKYLVSEMAKNLSVSLLGDTNKFELFNAISEGDLKTARAADAQNKPNIYFGEDSFWITVVR